MLFKTRLLFGVLVSCGGTLIPFLSAQAQDAVTNQAYAQMNQVQQELSGGLINTAQANDLMSRYNDILVKDQQWSAQDGGRLNVPDRLDLQGKLKSNSKRLTNDLKNNGFTTTTGGILPGLFGSTYNALPYGTTALNTVPYGLGTTALNTVPYGLGTTALNTVPYGLGTTALTAMPYRYASGTTGATASPYGVYPVSPAGYAGNNYAANPYALGSYNNGSGVFQGLLNRWRGY